MFDNWNACHLDSAQDSERPAAEDGVLEDGGDVLVAGLDKADRLAEREGQGARPVVILEIVADREVSVDRDAMLWEVACGAHAWGEERMREQFIVMLISLLHPTLSLLCKLAWDKWHPPF